MIAGLILLAQSVGTQVTAVPTIALISGIAVALVTLYRSIQHKQMESDISDTNTLTIFYKSQLAEATEGWKRERARVAELEDKLARREKTDDR
jgi:hypothetical protein